MGKSNEYIFKKIFKKNKNKIAIKSFNRKVTYKSLLKKTNELIEYFNSKNLRKNNVILVSLPNSLEFIYCYLACMIGGFIICPVNLKENKKEINKIIKAVKPSLIIKNLDQVKFKKTKINYLNFFDENNLMGIFLSSGTTGIPKGIGHNSFSILTNANEFNKFNKIKKNINFLHLFPMSYMAGFLNSVISPLLAGGTIIFREQFSINIAMRFWDLIIKEKINYVWLNPTMIKTILRFENRIKKINHKIFIFVGTAALDLEDKINFKNKFNINCLESYGMTEILLLSSEKFNHNKKIYSNVGQILPKCKIFRKKNKLIVNSPYTNKYYFSLKNKKFEKNINHNFFNTGDLGKIDKKSNLIILGREKNIIIKGGLNISPENLEKKFLAFDNTSTYLIVDFKDAYYGENICLVIKTLDNRLINEKKLDKFLKITFAKQYRPKKIIQINNLIKNINGKLIRKDLIKNINNNKKIKILYEKNY